MAIPRAREHFALSLDAPWLTIGNHTRLDVAIGGDWIAKPSSAAGNIEATHIMLQATDQAIRYRIDGGQASATVGFQLAAGAIVTVAVPNNGVSVFEEAAGAIVQYQWLG